MYPNLPSSSDAVSGPLELSQSAVRVLAACAQAARLFPELGWNDELAPQLFERMNDGNIFFPEQWLNVTARRAVAIDDLLRVRVEALPRQTQVIAVGSVLSTRAHRLSDVPWLDVDVPEVAALRKRLLPPRERWRQLAASSLEHDWLPDALPAPRTPALFVVDEAWLPFEEASWSSVLEHLCRHGAAGSELIMAIDDRTPIGRAPSSRTSGTLEVRSSDGTLARFPRLRFTDPGGGVDGAARQTANRALLTHLQLV